MYDSQIYERCKRVLESCETQDQYEAGLNWCALLLKMFPWKTEEVADEFCETFLSEESNKIGFL